MSPTDTFGQSFSERMHPPAASITWTTRLFLALLCVFPATDVLCAPLDADSLSAFRGDATGDGVEDLYIEAEGDIVIFGLSPLRLFRKAAESGYLLRGLADGRFADPEVAVVAKNQLREIDFQSADFDGDTEADILLSDSPGVLVLLVIKPDNQAPEILAQIDAMGGRSVTIPAAVVNMLDVDADGYADVSVVWPEGTQHVFYNAGDGDWSFRDDPGLIPALAQDDAPKFAVIGDSIAAGTHTTEMCGNRDVIDCINHLGERLSPEWSYATANASWSIASRLGYDPKNAFNAADSGERWKDAYDQAVRVMEVPGVETVLIGLGANDVCRDPGHNYGDDLSVIATQIDETLGYLLDRLPLGAEVIMTGVPNVGGLRELMRFRDHNIVFESCQATWDISTNQIKDGAAQSACDHFAGHNFCEVVDNTEDAKDFLTSLLLDLWLDDEGIEEGPCGKVLSSDATDTDQKEAAQFTRELNRLIASKARDFSMRNGITVSFSDAVYQAEGYAPHHISRFDCYHPSRTGQKYFADAIWSGLRPGASVSGSVHTDRFDEIDYCSSESAPWASCWSESNDNDSPVNGDVYIQGGRLRVKDNVRTAQREVDLTSVSRAWLSFNHRRKDLDRNSEAVVVEMSVDDGANWSEVTRVGGDGDDFGQQRGDDYQITGFTQRSAVLRLRSERLGGEDEVQFDNFRIFSWPVSPPAGPPALRELTVDASAQTVPLPHSVIESVVLTGPSSDRDGQPSIVELSNVADSAAYIRLLPFGTSGGDAAESAPMLTLEKGVFLPGDGSIWQVGSASASPGWTLVDFTAPFEVPPRVFLNVQASDQSIAIPRVRNVTVNGFELATFGAAADATVGYVALSGGESAADLKFADGERPFQTDTVSVDLGVPQVLGTSLGVVNEAGDWLDSFTVEALRIGDQLFAREVTESTTASVVVRLDTP